MRAILLSVLLLSVLSSGIAQPAPPLIGLAKTTASEDLNDKEKTLRGWFFGEDPTKKVAEPAPVDAPKVPTPAPSEKKPVEDKCKSGKTWTADCGFMDPGVDFEFQAKQRDALLVQMSMSQNDPKAVEQFQYYMKWVVGRASEVANLWQFNMAQNPELDPAVKQPISSFGVRLMSDVQHGKEAEIYKMLKDEGAMLVYFTKSDCTFCHVMAPTLKDISRDTGLPVRNASLDGACLPEFLEGCMFGDATTGPASALQVAIVPTAFLYVKPNTWIRVSTGVTDRTTMRSRIFSFFTAYRSAMLKGINNGQKGRPSVDFSSDQELAGNAKGVDTKPESESKVPEALDVERLLGKQK